MTWPLESRDLRWTDHRARIISTGPSGDDHQRASRKLSLETCHDCAELIFARLYCRKIHNTIMVVVVQDVTPIGLFALITFPSQRAAAITVSRPFKAFTTANTDKQNEPRAIAGLRPRPPAVNPACAKTITLIIGANLPAAPVAVIHPLQRSASPGITYAERLE